MLEALKRRTAKLDVELFHDCDSMGWMWIVEFRSHTGEMDRSAYLRFADADEHMERLREAQTPEADLYAVIVRTGLKDKEKANAN